MQFYLNCGMVAVLLFTVVRVSLARLVRRRERLTERLEVRSSAPASAVVLAQAQMMTRGRPGERAPAAGVTSAHTGS
jgi:hypothetical protein